MVRQRYFSFAADTVRERAAHIAACAVDPYGCFLIDEERELTEFLHYLEHTTDAVAEQTESARIRRIHDRVRQVRSDEEIGVKYMQAWEEKYYDRQEAREEGLQEGRTEGRTEGIKEAKRCMAQRLTKMGLSIEQIAKAAEVDIAVLEQWLKEDTVHR